jgi:hypothetical protein
MAGMPLHAVLRYQIEGQSAKFSEQYTGLNFPKIRHINAGLGKKIQAFLAWLHKLNQMNNRAHFLNTAYPLVVINSP